MNPKKYSILVVDDDPPILELLGEYLSTRGHECETASNITQAIDLLNRTAFDVIITDLKMPNGGGLQLLKTIQVKNISTAIIMMTGYGTIESALQAMKHGAHDYLLKPFRLKEVYDSMEQAISKQQVDRDTVRLKHILNLQEIASKAISLDHFSGLYHTLASASKDELNGTGAVVAFYESDRGVWQEYCRTEGAPLGRIDLHSIGESLLEGQVWDKKTAWFSGPRPLIVNPIHAITVESAKRSIVGFVAVTDPSNHIPNPDSILNIYGAITGTALSLCLVNCHKTRDAFSDPIRTKDSKSRSSLLECLASELEIKPEEAAAVKCAIKLLIRPDSTLRERYNGLPMELMTIGGGGLPFNVLSLLEPLLLSAPERHDGQGSPSGLAGDKVDGITQVVHLLTLFETLTSTRAFAHTMTQSEALSTIGEHYKGAVSPEVLAAFSRALEKSTQA